MESEKGICAWVLYLATRLQVWTLSFSLFSLRLYIRNTGHLRARVESFFISCFSKCTLMSYITFPLICPWAGSAQPETHRNVDYMFVSPVERWWLWRCSSLEATGKALLLCGLRGEKDTLEDEWIKRFRQQARRDLFFILLFQVCFSAVKL